MNESLAGLVAYTLPFHQGFMHALSAAALIYLAITQFGALNQKYVLRVRYFLPIYHGILAASILTGLILLASFNFTITMDRARMIIAVVALIALSGISHKRLKLAWARGELPKFRRFALFKGLVDIALILFAGL